MNDTQQAKVVKTLGEMGHKVGQIEGELIFPWTSASACYTCVWPSTSTTDTDLNPCLAH